MHRNTNAQRLALVASLLCAVSSTHTSGQLAEEVSVPEPTHLHAIASAEGSQIVSYTAVGEIASVDATAVIASIEVEGHNGQRVRGIKIQMQNATTSYDIYITDSLLAGFRAELQELEHTKAWYGKCQAKRICVHGIARCRPSQSEPQAYCPAHYTTPDADHGLILDTPHGAFSFPGVTASQLNTLIGTLGSEQRDRTKPPQ